MDRSYVFMSQPRPVAKRKKYRSPDTSDSQNQTDDGSTTKFVGNIMHDPRVYRGRPLSRASSAGSKTAQPPQGKPKYRRPKKSTSSKPFLDSVSFMHEQITVTKTREEVPLHLYLVEQEDENAHKTTNMSVQTDVFLPKDPPPPYVPQKTGLDMSTQVDTKQVFDFDRDVEPLLGVVVSKILEQSFMEVRQETELHNMATHTSQMKDQLRRERKEADRLVALEQGRLEAKRKRLVAACKQAEDDSRLQHKLEAVAVSRIVVSDILKQTLDDLTTVGFLYDPVARKCEDEFMPWLYDEVSIRLREQNQGHKLMDELIQRAHEQLQEQAQREIQERKEQRDKQRRTIIELYIHTKLVGDKPVGPLQVRFDATIQDVGDKVVQWMTNNLAKPPKFHSLSFNIHQGAPLPKETLLYSLGVDNLASLQMHIVDRQDADDEDEDEEEEDED